MPFIWVFDTRATNDLELTKSVKQPASGIPLSPAQHWDQKHQAQLAWRAFSWLSCLPSSSHPYLHHPLKPVGQPVSPSISQLSAPKGSVCGNLPSLGEPSQPRETCDGWTEDKNKSAEHGARDARHGKERTVCFHLYQVRRQHRPAGVRLGSLRGGSREGFRERALQVIFYS